MSRFKKSSRDTKVVAVIPARGGSKRVPLKNIRELAGKPLIAYTIEAALESKTLDRVIVSTDHDEIARISKKYGAEVPFKRPADLAGDVPSEPVIQHAIRYLEEKEAYKPGIVVILQPTSPFRKAKTIDDAVNKMLETSADSVVSVCKIEERPEWMIRIDQGWAVPFMYAPGEEPEIRMVDSQALPPLYTLNGAVYVVKRDMLMNQGKIIAGRLQAVIMEKKESLDIDSYLDFSLAEFLIKEAGSEPD